MPPRLAPLILLNITALVTTIRLPKFPFANYSLAINIERQLKGNTGIPLACDVSTRVVGYNLLEDLITSYTRSYNRIFPIIAHNIKRLSTFKLQSTNHARKAGATIHGDTKATNCWEIAKSSPNNKLKCSVQLTVPDSTILVRVVNRDNPKLTVNSPYTSIQVLNLLRRTNPNAIEMIYYKSNIPFEHLLGVASLPTLLIGVLIEYPLLIQLLSYATFGCISFVLKGFMWKLLIKILTSRLFWHPTVYNIWCSIYYKTSGPAKLFTLKQVLDNVTYLCTEIYKVFLDATIYTEGIMLERDLRKYIQSQATDKDIITIDCSRDRLFTHSKS